METLPSELEQQTKPNINVVGKYVIKECGMVMQANTQHNKALSDQSQPTESDDW